MFGGDEQYDTQEERRNTETHEQPYIRQINAWEQTNNPESPNYQPVRYNHKLGVNLPHRRFGVNEMKDKTTYPEWKAGQKELGATKPIDDGIK